MRTTWSLWPINRNYAGNSPNFSAPSSGTNWALKASKIIRRYKNKVFISIVLLYYLQILFHARLHHSVADKLRSMTSHWYFYEGLFYRIFDFAFALIGFLLFKYYRTMKNFPEDILFVFAIPALFPLFIFGEGSVAYFFIKPCFIPQYTGYENIIIWVGHIFFYLYAIFFSIYVLMKMSRQYAIIFLFEFFIFLAYLSLFYGKIVGPIRIPIHF